MLVSPTMPLHLREGVAAAVALVAVLAAAAPVVVVAVVVLAELAAPELLDFEQ